MQDQTLNPRLRRMPRCVQACPEEMHSIGIPSLSHLTFVCCVTYRSLDAQDWTEAICSIRACLRLMRGVVPGTLGHSSIARKRKTGYMGVVVVHVAKNGSESCAVRRWLRYPCPRNERCEDGGQRECLLECGSVAPGKWRIRVQATPPAEMLVADQDELAGPGDVRARARNRARTSSAASTRTRRSEQSLSLAVYRGRIGLGPRSDRACSPACVRTTETAWITFVESSYLLAQFVLTDKNASWEKHHYTPTERPFARLCGSRNRLWRELTVAEGPASAQRVHLARERGTSRIASWDMLALCLCAEGGESLRSPWTYGQCTGRRARR